MIKHDVHLTRGKLSCREEAVDIMFRNSFYNLKIVAFNDFIENIDLLHNASSHTNKEIL